MRRDLFLPFSFSLSIALMGLLMFFPAGNGVWAAEKADQPLVDLGAELAKIKKTEQPADDDKKPVEKKETSASDEVKIDEKAAKNETSHAVQWSYSGETGPRFWGELMPENQICKTGRNQSPIDLRDAAALGTQGLPGLDIVYREVPLKIINNGHSVQVNYPLGSYIKLGNHRYELLQYHFHTPSEHHKEGFAYPMEMHFVHKDGDGNLAVLGVLFQEGETNPYLNGILKRLPKEVGKQEIYEDLKLNPVNFLPANTEFYKYSGSLTTPPCSEGVYWVVFKHPIEASARQIQQLNELMGDNARPVQPEFARHLLKSWMEPDNDRQLYEFY
ncbi:MAG: carbonic anhydrase family protein [Thiomicrorhabdus chilensis]|uniref:carbonic anhydrase n=1 Tax=Thiomicrorhabdus chilensis TaxID=63656 RepID=UPI00299D6395|nr:carbonic anhydrase family protein [Thiomicrorhabdus chilensis]MDX1346797.1 carbonic anhydrase family protein [Thiomicrorhabdus chilensis]